MKKLFKVIAIIFFALSFISCAKKIDSSVWLTSYADAKKAASEENKLIFAFFSETEGDEHSQKLKENLFDTEDFIKTYTEKYVLLNLDYSSSLIESEPEKLSGDMRIFESYDINEVPAFFLLSPEGYAITKLAFSDEADMDVARITFDETEETARKFKENLIKTKNGTNEERLAAIEEIYEGTAQNLRYHLRPLSELYLSLDKKNETENYTKHAISVTYAKAQDYLMDGENEKACEEFVKLAENKNLTVDDKQMSYYTAGYLLASSGSQNLEKITGYFKQAYDINPESEAAANIKMSIDYVQALIDGNDSDTETAQAQENTAEEQLN